jgi:hypothetical protein
MPYRFHRCQTHPKIPDMQGWYLELRPDDPETLMKIHRGVAALYFVKFGQGPHFKDNPHYSWSKLAAQWLVSVERLLWSGPVFVNENGGILPADSIISLEVVESEHIDWDVRYEDEVITIARWPEGNHYYLASNKHRIFVPDKYNHYADARNTALRFVTADRIKGNC